MKSRVPVKEQATRAALLPALTTHHQETLKTYIQEIRASLGLKDADAVYAQAKRLYLELMRHIEEENSPKGFYGEIEHKAPRFSFWLKRLRLQHQEILDDLRMICADSDDDLASIAPMIEDCLALIVRNELDEEELIDEAFFRDEGAGG